MRLLRIHLARHLHILPGGQAAILVEQVEGVTGVVVSTHFAPVVTQC